MWGPTPRRAGGRVSRWRGLPDSLPLLWVLAKRSRNQRKAVREGKKPKKKKNHFILPEQNLIENCEKHTETQNHTFYKHSATNTFFFFSSAWCWWSWVWSQCPIQVLIRERCVTRCLWTVTRQTHKKTLYKYNVGMRDIDFFQPIPIITYFSRPMLIRLSISFTFVNCKKKFDTCSLHTPEGKKGSDVVR